MAKKGTLSEIQAELSELQKRQAELKEQLEGFEQLSAQRDAIIECRKALGSLTLSDSLADKENLAADIATAQKLINQVQSSLNGERRGRGRGAGGRADGGKPRFMRVFGAVLADGKLKSDAEIVNHPLTQTYMNKKGLNRHQVLQGIADAANAGKLDSPAKNHYRLPGR